MSTVQPVILLVHIAAGVAALFAGIGAVVTTKGGLRHRQAGKTYVASMGVVVGTVLPLFLFDPTDFFLQFLLLVAVFSGYLAFSGYRVLSRKRPKDTAAPVDWVAASLVVLACLGLAGMGGSLLADGDSFGVVMAVFGLIGGSFGVADIRIFAGSDDGAWIEDHLSRMLGAFIATVTAVSAVNLTMLPRIVTWLGPTAVGVPLIFYWKRKYGSD